jgi:hypothetical protein
MDINYGCNTIRTKIIGHENRFHTVECETWRCLVRNEYQTGLFSILGCFSSLFLDFS